MEKYKYNKYKKKYLLLKGGSGMKVFIYTRSYFYRNPIIEQENVAFVQSIRDFIEKEYNNTLIAKLYESLSIDLGKGEDISRYDYDIILTDKLGKEVYSYYNKLLGSTPLSNLVGTDNVYEDRSILSGTKSVKNSFIVLYRTYARFEYSREYSKNGHFSALSSDNQEKVRKFFTFIHDDIWFDYKPFLEFFTKTPSDSFIEIMRNIDPFYNQEMHLRKGNEHTHYDETIRAFEDVIESRKAKIFRKHDIPIKNMFEKLLDNVFFDKPEKYNTYIATLYRKLPRWLHSKVIWTILFHARNLKERGAEIKIDDIIKKDDIIKDDYINDKAFFALIIMDGLSPDNHKCFSSDEYSSEFEGKLYKNECIQKAYKYKSMNDYDLKKYWKLLKDYYETLGERLKKNSDVRNIMNKAEEAKKEGDLEPITINL